MGAKLTMSLTVLLASIPGFAQVQPAARTVIPIRVQLSAGAGMDYWSGDWGGQIDRWGPSVWATATFWHCLGINADGHSMILCGNHRASSYKLFVAEGGLMCTSGYWGRFQPIAKGELGLASLSQGGGGPGPLHSTYTTWSVGGGVEYHTGDIGGREWSTPTTISCTFTVPSPTSSTPSIRRV